MTTYLGSLSWPDKGISPCSPSLCVEDRAEMPCGKGSLVCVWLLCQSHAHHPQSQPLFELRCSNNVVHVHSCADSCALLVNLLQYVTSSGDLHPPPQPPSPTEIAGQKVQMRPGHTGYQSLARPLSLHIYKAWNGAALELPLPLVFTPAPPLS